MESNARSLARAFHSLRLRVDQTSSISVQSASARHPNEPNETICLASLHFHQPVSFSVAAIERSQPIGKYVRMAR